MIKQDFHPQQGPTPRQKDKISKHPTTLSAGAMTFLSLGILILCSWAATLTCNSAWLPTPATTQPSNKGFQGTVPYPAYLPGPDAPVIYQKGRMYYHWQSTCPVLRMMLSKENQTALRTWHSDVQKQRVKPWGRRVPCGSCYNVSEAAHS